MIESLIFLGVFAALMLVGSVVAERPKRRKIQKLYQGKL